MKRLIVILAVLALAGLAVFWIGNRGNKGAEVLGKPVDSEAKAVELSDIVQNPAAYRDEIIVTEGRIGALGCVDCGGVIVTDKTWRLSVEPENPQEFRIPLKPGARIKVWGVVHVEGGGEEAEEKSETKHEEEEAGMNESEEHKGEGTELAIVELKARGVEIQ